MELKQAKQKQSHDPSKPLRSFEVGDMVFSENFTGKSPKWITSKIAQVTGLLAYVVKLPDGTTMRRHVDDVICQDCSMDSTSD